MFKCPHLRLYTQLTATHERQKLFHPSTELSRIHKHCSGTGLLPIT